MIIKKKKIHGSSSKNTISFCIIDLNLKPSVVKSGVLKISSVILQAENTKKHINFTKNLTIFIVGATEDGQAQLFPQRLRSNSNEIIANQPSLRKLEQLQDQF